MPSFQNCILQSQICQSFSNAIGIKYFPPVKSVVVVVKETRKPFQTALRKAKIFS